MEIRLASPAEVIARHTITFGAWGKKLSLEQYLSREKKLAATTFGGDSHTWLLVDGDQILASCDSFRMRSLRRAYGKMEEGSTYGIATVFVEAPLRGKGHATALLEQLVANYGKEAETHACILFSEIGTPIYERVGFSHRPATSRIYAPPEKVPPGNVADPIGLDEIEATIGLRGHAPRHAFRIDPTIHQIEWHMVRSRFYAEVLGRKPANTAGARADDAWAIWAPNYKTDRLDVLFLAPGLPDGTRAVIEAARREASAYKLSEVSIWENPDNIDKLTGGETVERQANIPMIRPIGEGLEVSDWTDYSRSLWV